MVELLVIYVFELHTAPSRANIGVVQCAMLRVHEHEFRRIIKNETYK